MLKNLGFCSKKSFLLIFSFTLYPYSLLNAAPSQKAGAFILEVQSKDMGMKRLSENEPQAIIRKEDPTALGGSVYILNNSVTIKAAENFSLDNVTIITNGYPLFIEANDTLSAKSTVIKSFEKNLVTNIQPISPPSPKEAAKDGLPGYKGTDGKSANIIHLKATHIVGNLTILNDGQNGGPGGPGGSASVEGIRGADGKNYAPEKSLGDAGKVLNKITGKKTVFRPEIMATPGERGSPGGLPGPAGSGGDGGDAGSIILNAEHFDLNVYYSQKGGKGGYPALNARNELAHGFPGVPGVGGNSGRKKDNTFDPYVGNGPDANASDHPRAELYKKIMNGEFSKHGNIGTSSQPEIRSSEENKNKLPRGLSLKAINQN
jgi:hypothetical protein